MAAMGAVIHGPGEGEHHAVGASSLTLKATSEHTDGGFFLSETVVEPGFPGPPLHRHRELTDMFYVLEGTLTLTVDGDEAEAPPGTFACVPPGTVHTFANCSDGPVRFLNFNIPGGSRTTCASSPQRWRTATALRHPRTSGVSPPSTTSSRSGRARRRCGCASLDGVSRSACSPSRGWPGATSRGRSRSGCRGGRGRRYRTRSWRGAPARRSCTAG